MTDLTGAGSPQCTTAESTNATSEAVGHNCDETDALLWANGKQYDLNTLVAPSPLQMTVATYVNNEGDIVGAGVLPDGSLRVFLLVPNQSVPLPQAATTARPLPSARRQPDRVTDLAGALQGSDRTGTPPGCASSYLAIDAERAYGDARPAEPVSAYDAERMAWPGSAREDLAGLAG
jgi:hypothetical protein